VRFDYLCVPLRCPRCGADHDGADPLDAECQTTVRADPTGEALRLGERHALKADMTDGAYWPTIDAPSASPTGRVRVIDEWACSACGLNYLWVKATWNGGVLEEAHAVTLTEGELLDCDFISNMCTDLAPPDVLPSTLTALPVAEFRSALARFEADRWARVRREDAERSA
jgi:hypothetical protein